MGRSLGEQEGRAVHHAMVYIGEDSGVLGKTSCFEQGVLEVHKDQTAFMIDSIMMISQYSAYGLALQRDREG